MPKYCSSHALLLRENRVFPVIFLYYCRVKVAEVSLIVEVSLIAP